MAVQAVRPFFLTRPEATVGSSETSSTPHIPCGVPDFDYLTGGVPPGSVILLVGEAGSGHHEFALTSAVHLMLHFDDPRMHQFYLGSAKGPFLYPQGVVYVSLSRSKEQVLREVQSAFDPSYHRVLVDHLKFHDLSPAYFADSVVPPSWSALPSPLLSAIPSEKLDGAGPLGALAGAVDGDGKSNLVIVDSLTDLVVRRGVDPEELVTLIKGLRRRAKDWNGLVYLLLSKGVGTPATEQAIFDSVDGVLSFGWTTSPYRSSRQRVMLIEKFMPVLSRVPHEHQGRFVIRVSSLSGLVTTQYERI